MENTWLYTHLVKVCVETFSSPPSLMQQCSNTYNLEFLDENDLLQANISNAINERDVDIFVVTLYVEM
jgi:hypothetical protein